MRLPCERWKLIRYPQVNQTQLFDLQNDPQEITNLAEQPERAKKIVELSTLLEKELRQLDDTAPLKVAKPQPADWVPPVGK